MLKKNPQNAPESKSSTLRNVLEAATDRRVLAGAVIGSLAMSGLAVVPKDVYSNIGEGLSGLGDSIPGLRDVADEIHDRGSDLIGWLGSYSDNASYNAPQGLEATSYAELLPTPTPQN